MNWYRAELDGKEGLIPSNYIQMKNHRYCVNNIYHITFTPYITGYIYYVYYSIKALLFIIFIIHQLECIHINTLNSTYIFYVYLEPLIL